MLLTTESAGSRWAWSFDVFSDKSSRTLTPLYFLCIDGFTGVPTPTPAGFGIHRATDHASVVVTFPFWLVLIALTPSLIVAWRSWRLHRSHWLAGRCISCGYDLRATPDRCPECGLAPGASASPDA
jgi:hypothetical protein